MHSDNCHRLLFEISRFFGVGFSILRHSFSERLAVVVEKLCAPNREILIILFGRKSKLHFYRACRSGFVNTRHGACLDFFALGTPHDHRLLQTHMLLFDSPYHFGNDLCFILSRFYECNNQKALLPADKKMGKFHSTCSKIKRTLIVIENFNPGTIDSQNETPD